MTTASLFKNGRNQAVRLPKDLEFEGVSEVDVRREDNSIILTPVRKNWKSFSGTPAVDEDFLTERQDVIDDGRVEF
ncbi:MAG: type II toxin-antitoxin system VapB family antitoxin [Pseudomonadales bacterium]